MPRVRAVWAFDWPFWLKVASVTSSSGLSLPGMARPSPVIAPITPGEPGQGRESTRDKPGRPRNTSCHLTPSLAVFMTPGQVRVRAAGCCGEGAALEAGGGAQAEG